MDNSNKLDDWTDEEVSQLKTLWESDIAKKYKKRIEDLKKDVLNVCMFSPDKDQVVRFAGIACGYESVLQDIEMLIKSKKKEKEDAAKKK